MKTSEKLRIGVIGGGWFGCHAASQIKEKFPTTEVTIFEKNFSLFSEVSGQFGIRLHAGPHYPRSAHTRQACHQGFTEFLNYYPNLVNEHVFSHYALGTRDLNNSPPMVTKEKFASVCAEFGNAVELNPSLQNYEELDYLADLYEPSLVLGHRLRKFFWNYLKTLGVEIRCNFEVQKIRNSLNGSVKRICGADNEIYDFDHVINATCYKSFLPPQISKLIGAKVLYHALSALIYECTEPLLPNKPFSFIVMDGCFPCLMPYDDRPNPADGPVTKYMVTHAKFTTLGSYDTPAEAEGFLNNINAEFMENEVQIPTELDMLRFWPSFREDFKCIGWVNTVLPKLETSTAYPNAVTFKDIKSGIIHVFPGKINNVFDTTREILRLVGLEDGKVIEKNNFAYAESGCFDSSVDEIGNSASACK